MSHPTAPPLFAEETALLVAHLASMYGKEKGKETTRFRLSRTSVRFLSLHENLREAFVAEFVDALARFGWVAFPRGEEFGLIQKSAIAGWVRIGTKRVMDDQRALRNMNNEQRGRYFAEIQAGLQDLVSSEGEEVE
jgi:hypothetical protein